MNSTNLGDALAQASGLTDEQQQELRVFLEQLSPEKLASVLNLVKEDASMAKKLWFAMQREMFLARLDSLSGLSADEKQTAAANIRKMSSEEVEAFFAALGSVTSQSDAEVKLNQALKQHAEAHQEVTEAVTRVHGAVLRKHKKQEETKDQTLMQKIRNTLRRS